MQKRGLFLLAFVLGAVPVNAGLGRKGPAIPSVPKKALFQKQKQQPKSKQQPKQPPKQKQKQPQKQKPVPPKKTNGGRFGKAKSDTKSGHNKRAAANKSGVVVAASEFSLLSKTYHTYQSVKDFLLTSSGPEEPPYLLVGIRYLVVAMFFCLAALAIIDSFSKVPSVFGDTILVVPRY